MFPPQSIYDALGEVLAYYEETPAIERAFTKCFANVFEHLPLSYWSEDKHSDYRGPTIPLYDALDDCGQTITDAVLPLFDKELVEHGYLSALRKQLLENEAHMNGLSMYERRKKFIPAPQERDEPPRELCFLYFKDTPFLEFFNAQIPWRIPDEVRPEHVLMIASTGSGKTQFIQQDVLSQLSRPDPPGMVVIDSQNQMIPKLERLRVARDRIVIVDPFDEQPPALNMFIAPKRIYDANLKEAIENETLQQFAWIFSALDQELTGRMTTLFTFTARILLSMAPHSNIMTLLEFLRIEKPQQLRTSVFWPFINASDEQSRYFFDERFCTADYNKTKAGVADRLLGVIRVPAFNRMFMANDNRLDLYRELAQRKLIVFNTQKRKLGPDASALLGRYAIALYIRSAFEREADRASPPAFLYIDEASEYFGKRDSSDTLFTQLRKYNCGSLFAFQDASQLQQQTATLVANTTTKLAARISPTDARLLASAMRTSTEHLLGINKQPTSFQMACYIKDTPRALTITFPYGAVENAPQLTDLEYQELRKSNRKHLAYQGPSKPEPAASNQQLNESSLRDTSLQVPERTYDDTAEPPQPIETNPEQPRPVAPKPAASPTAATDPTAPPTLQPPQDDWRS